jgi:hypothetical protein
MVRSVVRVPILSAEQIKVAPGTSIGKLENFTKNVNFGKDVQLIKAELKVRATQTYLSGADLLINVNGIVLSSLQWHGFENGSKTKEWIVTSAILDGVNSWDITYTLAFGTVTEQIAVVNMELVLTIEKPNAGDDGVDVGETTETGTKAKIGQALRESANFIVAIGVLGAIITAGGYIAYTKVK